MPFQTQATPQSSHLPSMADRRLPSMSIPPPGPYSHAIADYRVLPAPLNPNLPSISQFNPHLVNHPSTNFSQGYFPAFQVGSNVQAYPLLAHDAAGFLGAGSTSNTPSSAPAVTTTGSHSHAALMQRMGMVEFGQLGVDRHFADLEVFTRNYSGEEKGKVYLGLWVAIRQVGLRDKQNVRFFIAKSLMPYPWFKGDDTIGEALGALHRLEFINCGLIAKKHTENAKWFWDKRIGDLSVREYWIQEGRKQRQRQNVQAHAQTQAQDQAEEQD